MIKLLIHGTYTIRLTIIIPSAPDILKSAASVRAKSLFVRKDQAEEESQSCQICTVLIELICYI
jgi:hypothetical protein